MCRQGPHLTLKKQQQVGWGTRLVCDKATQTKPILAISFSVFTILPNIVISTSKEEAMVQQLTIT